jgi:L-ascorbate metabolism protein UlaG (beta-lactamase superfamily)
MQFRWLGNAGFALTAHGQTLAIDPFFTRPPFLRMFWGRVEPDRRLVERYLPACDHVLVTCARWDHLMDVPAVLQKTRARCHAPARACELLLVLGVPEEQICQVQAGDSFHVGPFDVRVLPADHRPNPLDWYLNGPLPANLEPPLRIRDYRMVDRHDNLSYWIGAGEASWLLARQHALPASVLAVMPFEKTERLARLLAEVRPRLVIPYHWDDLFRPLSEPLRPLWKPPQMALLSLQRIDLDHFVQRVAALDPRVVVFTPEMMQEYDLQDVTSSRDLHPN